MPLSKSILKLLSAKDRRLLTVPEDVDKAINPVQRRVFEDLLLSIGRLSVTGGSFDVTDANLRAVVDIADQLRALLDRDDYQAVITGFLDEFDAQAGLNDEVLRKVLGETNTDVARSLLLTFKDGARRKIVPASLDAPFITPIRERLENAVATGASLRDTLTALKVDIQGGEIDGRKVKGKLARYVKQIASDAFSQADRAYVNAASDTQWRYYTEGTIEDSRVFCIERNGEYYHIEEIRDWGRGKDMREAGKNWQGKVKGTNKDTILTYLGGHNCQHSLMSVGLGIVPRNVIERAIAKGYFKPTATERTLLGL